MLFIGIDDTDVAGAPGTNKLARRLAARLGQRWPVFGITRHQLLIDPRIPYTAKNSSAAIMLDRDDLDPEEAARLVCEFVQAESAAGSDPGVCVGQRVPAEVLAFGRRAQREVLSQAESRRLAERFGLFLAGLGGTEDGVTGALAAVALAASADDGRFVQLGSWPDDLSGVQSADVLEERGVAAFLQDPTGEPLEPHAMDVGKRLRPAYRSGRIVLYVAETAGGWHAVRKT